MPRADLRPPPGSDLVDLLLSLPEEVRARRVRLLGLEFGEALDRGWAAWAHDGQRPPDGDWRAWVIMAGRGFGKTLAGAQWVREAVRAAPGLQVALVAATIEEARQVMVEGASGLATIAVNEVEDWNPTRGRLRFANGAVATLFSGCSPEKLRGPEHHIAWCDELAKWSHPRETWDNLQLGLRLGDRPRALVTTTPRPGPTLRRIMAEPGCVVTRGRTADNPHISAAFKVDVERLYRGTRVGAQELDGQLLPDGGALWTPEGIEACRVGRLGEIGSRPDNDVRHPGLEPGSRFFSGSDGEGADGSGTPDQVRGDGEGVAAGARVPFTRVLLGVDPPSGDGTCGIVACAIDADGIGHVLADHSVAARSPEGWARAVADAAEVHGTRMVVAERNQGGRMVQSVLNAAGRALQVKLVHAADSKVTRADPIALLFEAGRVRLHGRFPELEAELLGMVSGAPYQGSGASPDRADAMVWALSELMIGRRAAPSVRLL